MPFSVFVMTTVPNWSLSEDEDGDICVRSYWRDRNPASPVPAQIAQFIQLGAYAGNRNGARMLPTSSTYTKVVFTIKRNKIRRNQAISGFVYDGFKGVTLVFGFSMRAQNPKYDIQTEDEINEILGL